MFPDIPSDLSTVEDEQLGQLRDELLAQIKNVAAHRRDPDVVGELTQAEVTDQLEAAVAQLELVKSEIQARADQEGSYDSKVEELAAKAGVALSASEEEKPADDADAEENGDESDDEKPAEDASAGKSETLTAGARLRPLPAARRHKPTVTEMDPRGFRVTTQAAGLAPTFETGQHLNRRNLGELLNQLVRKDRVKPGQRAIVASASYEYPEERILDDRNGDRNTEKIQDVLGPAALVASGANCAPLTPIYELPGVETAARPVRDALPSFQATRGGVIVGTTPRMGDYDTSVGVVAAADNAHGGTFATKNCLRISCPDFTSIQVDAIYSCIEADNLAARSYPELMARIDELVRARQARIADSKLLTGISAGSKQMDGGSIHAGAVWSLLGDVYRAAAAVRSANRMQEAARLRAIFPAWIIDLLALDIARGQFDRFQTRQQIVSILEQAGINTAFHLDGSSTAQDGQVFRHPVDGQLDDFPRTAEWFLYPEGSWMHLDSGTLELGIVRDSTLNATNDFQNFAETWEQVAFVGVESLAITSRVCPSGEVAAPASVAGHCGT